MAVSAESDRTVGKQTGQNPDINLLSIRGETADPLSGIKRVGGDIIGAAVTIGMSKFPGMVAEAAGICMGPYAKIAGSGLAMAAGLIGGGFTNNLVAGRDSFAGEGFLRNAGTTALAKIGLTQIESTGMLAQTVANIGKYGVAGGGYQAMNIAMGDTKPDGTKYTLPEGLKSVAYAGVGTGLSLGLGASVGARILGDVGRGAHLAANGWALTFVPPASHDFRDVRAADFGLGRRAR